MTMDDFTGKLQSGLDDEESFAETLVPEHSPAEAPGAAKAPPTHATAAAKQPPWVGKIMGHFKLLRLIGEGATGMVIQAEDTHLRRIVALKVLRKKLTTGEKGKQSVEQFLREARAAASLEHPNIVRIYEINQHSGWWYIAMEMVEGNSLQEIVKAVGALPVSRACPIIADAAIGLQVAHEVGMIHRDIKPGNILVTRNGRGKLTDFGLVRVDDPNDPDDAYAHRSIGTPLYMAPEIIRRQAISPAVDIYSLGATLYYTLTGRPPYNAEKIEDVFDQHLHKAPPDIQEVLEPSSETLASLILRMMAKEPNARPSAGEVAAMLHAESIALHPDAMAASGPGGSLSGITWQGLGQSTRTGATGAFGHLTRTAGVKKVQGWGVWHRPRVWGSVAAVVMIGVGLAAWQVIRKPSATPTPDIRSLFPEAPIRYGTRNAGSLPVSIVHSAEIPPFSWKGKVDAIGWKFVASESGLYYYSIYDERASFIRADLCIGYQTAEDAQKEGKIPAP